MQTDAAQLLLLDPIPAKAKKPGRLSVYTFSLVSKEKDEGGGGGRGGGFKARSHGAANICAKKWKIFSGSACELGWSMV